MRRPLVRRREAAPEKEGGLYFSSPKSNIEFIRTGCTPLDCVLGGGWALGRVSNIVGDKSTGKTLQAIEAIANLFLQWKDARCRYNEAESAFDAEYAEALGVPFDRVEMREDCKTVEALYDDVDKWCKGLKKGQPALYVMDSLDALSDAAEMERDIGDSSFGAAKAKKLSEFFRRKVQELKLTRTHLMIISQTRDNIGVSFGSKHTRSGGKALDFYTSQVIWLAYKGIIKRQVSKIERAVGVEIKARCTKNKVGLPFRECEYEITFGFGIEDEKACKKFLVDSGSEKLAKLSGAELREAVVRRWFEIEKTFLPEKRKYGNDS